jgi:hypothetical protein
MARNLLHNDNFDLPIGAKDVDRSIASRQADGPLTLPRSLQRLVVMTRPHPHGLESKSPDRVDPRIEALRDVPRHSSQVPDGLGRQDDLANHDVTSNTVHYCGELHQRSTAGVTETTGATGAHLTGHLLAEARHGGVAHHHVIGERDPEHVGGLEVLGEIDVLAARGDLTGRRSCATMWVQVRPE